MMNHSRRVPCGFTLVELLVVIGIFVVLSAIMLPVGKRLRESSRATDCQSQLQRIGQALKTYYIDEQGVPIIAYRNGTVYQYDPANAPYFPGLQALYRLDYLKNRNTLHCPENRLDSAGKTMTSDSLEYYESYSGLDANATPQSGGSDPLKRYKYMPYRQALATDFAQDYLRQLSPPRDDNAGHVGVVPPTQTVTIGGQTYTTTDRSFNLPPDDTIVTWCNYHADTYNMNHHGQYLVLFWDGSVRYKDKELFTTGSFGPPEAWLVHQTDSAH